MEFSAAKKREWSDTCEVTLEPNDGGPGVRVSLLAACQSELVKTTLDGDQEDEPHVVLHQISSDMLSTVAAFMEHHATEPMQEIEMVSK